MNSYNALNHFVPFNRFAPFKPFKLFPHPRSPLISAFFLPRAEGGALFNCLNCLNGLNAANRYHARIAGKTSLPR
jgi:hypothetical protein